MEGIALVLTIVAIVLFVMEASRARPWSYGWIGMAVLSLSLLIWHAFAGLEPLFD